MKDHQNQEEIFKSNQEVYKNDAGKALFLDVEPDDDKHLAEQLDVLIELHPKGATKTEGNLLVVIANGSEELCHIKANYVNDFIEKHLVKKDRADLMGKIELKISPDETLSLSSGKLKYWESLNVGSKNKAEVFEIYRAEDIRNRTVSMCAEVHGIKGLENANKIYIMPGFNFKMLKPSSQEQLEALTSKIVVFDQNTTAGVSINQQNISSDDHKGLAELHEILLGDKGKVTTIGLTDTAANSIKWNEDYLIPNQIEGAVKENGVEIEKSRKTGEDKIIQGFFKNDISGNRLIDALKSAYKIDASNSGEFDKFYKNNESFQTIKSKNALSGEDIYNILKHFSYFSHSKELKLPSKNDIIIELMKDNLVTYDKDADNKTSFFLQREVDFTLGAGLYMDMIATNADFILGLLPEMIAKGELKGGEHFEIKEKEHRVCPFFNATAEGTLPVKEKNGKRKVDFSEKAKDQPKLRVVKLTPVGNEVLQKKAVSKLVSNFDTTKEYSNQVNPKLMPDASSPEELVERVRNMGYAKFEKLGELKEALPPRAPRKNPDNKQGENEAKRAAKKNRP